MKRVLNYLIALTVLAGILLTNGCAIETGNQPQISTDEPKAIETQVIPTKTKVPTPTRKATETQAPTPTKTETPEKYPIDINKIHNFPKSYEYMVNNLNEFVEAPDGFSDPEALYNWWTEKCIPALGNQEDLEPNVFGVPDVSTAGFGFHTMIYESKSLLSEPNIFYFRYNNKIYPVLVLTVEDEFNINVGTFAFIIHNKSQNGDDGFDALKTLSTGEKIASLFGQTDDILGGDQSLEIQKFLHSDFNWKDFNGYTWSNLEPGMLWKDRPNKYAIGLGAIRTYDD